MKYIRGQDGSIYSVSRLKPPCRRSIDGETIWQIEVITASGEDCVYATYGTEATAIDVYKTMESFMTSRSVMITFGLGVNSLPDIAALAVEAMERVLDRLDEEIERADDHLGESPTPLDDSTVGETSICPPSNPTKGQVWTDDRTGMSILWNGAIWIPAKEGPDDDTAGDAV